MLLIEAVIELLIFMLLDVIMHMKEIIQTTLFQEEMQKLQIVMN